MQYFCDVENREVKEIFPGVRIRTFWGEQMLLSIVDVEAKTVVPMHSHPHEQSGTVMSGEVTFNVGGETRVLRAGDTYIIPGGVEHSIWSGDTPAQVLDVFSPVREAYQY
jgi:quercetin dioxygenase-like cupin family protein